MRRMTPRSGLSVAVIAGILGLTDAGPGAAQDAGRLIDTRMTVGLGATVGPSYFGSDDYKLGPWGTVRFDYLRLPGGLSWGSAGAVGVREGFGLRGALRYIGSRDGRGELQGLDDVDATVEIGLGIGYETRDWRAFTDVRYGFGGHGAWVAEVGADAIYRPTEQLVVNMGPRLEFGTQEFMQTYFGVTDQESAASGLPAYSPRGGLTAVGFEVGARYAFTDAWGIEGAATYDRLVNDAADSPITGLGSADQFGFRLGITRTISLGF